MKIDASPVKHIELLSANWEIHLKRVMKQLKSFKGKIILHLQARPRINLNQLKLVIERRIKSNYPSRKAVVSLEPMP